MIVTRGMGVGSGVGSLAVAGMGGWSVEISKKIRKGGRGFRRRDARFFRLVRENLVTPTDSQKSDGVPQRFSKSKSRGDVPAVVKDVVSKFDVIHRDFSEKDFLKTFPSYRGYITLVDLTEIRVTLLGMMDAPDEKKATEMFAEIVRRLAEERDEEEVLHLISMLV